MTNFHIDLANKSQPTFINMAGDANMIKVGAIGNTVTMNVAINIKAIITANVAVVFALFSFKVSAIFTCSMHYPSSVQILMPVSNYGTNWNMIA